MATTLVANKASIQTTSGKKGTTFKGTVRSPSTVVRYLAALSHSLTFAVKNEDGLTTPQCAKSQNRKNREDALDFLMTRNEKLFSSLIKVDVQGFGGDNPQFTCVDQDI